MIIFRERKNPMVVIPELFPGIHVRDARPAVDGRGKPRLCLGVVR
jgi:hypothetical protein